MRLEVITEQAECYKVVENYIISRKEFFNQRVGVLMEARGKVQLFKKQQKQT